MNLHIAPIPMMRERPSSELPIAVIGGGPVGLAAATHLLRRGLEPIVLEAGREVGAAVRDWGHVPMFSPWGLNVDGAAAALLEGRGWAAPDPAGYPTGRDFVEAYLDPLSQIPEIASRLRLGLRVTGIARSRLGKVTSAGRGDNPFEVRFVDGQGWEGRLYARAVVDAAGAWFNPSPAGAGGLPALGERAAADRIRYGMPDVLGSERRRYAGQRVLVVGSGHSALGALIDLVRLAEDEPETGVVWVMRRAGPGSAFGGGVQDGLPARGALGMRLRSLVESGRVEVVTGFAIDEVARAPDGSLLVSSGSGGATANEGTLIADEMIVATGLRPDLSYLTELRLDLDPALECPRALAPLIDPNEHSCGTVRPHGAAELMQPEPGLFIVGMKAYGRAPTFLLATGYEQVRSVAAQLAGDEEAARRVELSLPETGVCSGPGTKPARQASDAEACCGAAPAGVEACCALDAAAKARGEDGCGCPVPAATAPASSANAIAACCE